MKNKVLKTIWEYLVLTFATFVFTVSWEAFMIPNGMSAGGIMGVCTILEFATGGFIKASLSFFIINAFLILLAVLVFGIGFGFKTIYCIVMSSVFLWLVGDWGWLHSIPGNFLYVEDKTLVPIIAGIFEALGIGLAIRSGGSTGGTDIIALIINKYWPVSLSGVFFVTDFIVVIAQLMLRPGFGSYVGDPKTFNDVMYGILEIVTFALTIDLFTVGGRKTMQLLIFSEKYQEIADYVCNTMERGVTVLKAQGWFTRRDRSVLLILLTRQELSNLSKVVNAIDPKAFLSVSNASGVYGEGFEQIKTGKLKLDIKSKKQQ
ncbi:MAG: YitT family protein [Bacteroidales bacterium]|nr:YitT family protein [Bacteroidales bacterium]